MYKSYNNKIIDIIGRDFPICLKKYENNGKNGFFSKKTDFFIELFVILQKTSYLCSVKQIRG